MMQGLSTPVPVATVVSFKGTGVGAGVIAATFGVSVGVVVGAATLTTAVAVGALLVAGDSKCDLTLVGIKHQLQDLIINRSTNVMSSA
jgi:hypothetical protein